MIKKKVTNEPSNTATHPPGGEVQGVVVSRSHHLRSRAGGQPMGLTRTGRVAPAGHGKYSYILRVSSVFHSIPSIVGIYINIVKLICWVVGKCWKHITL